MEGLDEYNTAIHHNVDLFIQELQAMISEARRAFPQPSLSLDSVELKILTLKIR